ncbi:glycosyltransferase family protein 64 C3 [Macadamia integrifolia]|uniref:glycosyltransferase family protein 64 C3 n=1 Tax=Macadamia integrifolia TaxID=60698 RepID=UPI001C4EBC38|nr:glycosyltransferase family protein 64 C3 [Macadamia integrifolia]
MTDVNLPRACRNLTCTSPPSLSLSLLFLESESETIMGKIPLILLFFIPIVAFSLRPLSPNPCLSKPMPQTLRSDRLTVLINGYSESRFHLLSSIAAKYSSCPSVAAVFILWGNPKTPTETLTQFNINITGSYYVGAPISILRQSSDSLNSRFLPRPSWITTRAVAICDDDVEIDTKSVEFAFKIWSSHQDNLIGFFARSHDFDLRRRTWIYTVHPDKYSIVLTKFMILKTDYLYMYSCESDMNEMRNVVDRMQNCEDILMNFVIAERTKSGPILIGAEKVRDWGDARNEKRESSSSSSTEVEDKMVREVGLSSRRRDHRKRRGDCIREFHKIWGRMSLRYSYGKVVNSVGEQGLCEKGGKLVFCDEQVLF